MLISSSQTIPRSIWALGFVSLFMDMSSEYIHSLLPVFMVSVLGSSMIWVGFVEGIAEAVSLIIRLFSGLLSDYLGKRKALTLCGYGLSMITKPFFPLANSIGTIIIARTLDRVGKGIRSAPRDALIADLAPQEIRGACFGLRQTLDTIGAILGPLLAIVLMIIANENIRIILWVAVIPAFISILILYIFVTEPKHIQSVKNPYVFKISILTSLNKNFWYLIITNCCLNMARFSEAFLILKGQSSGLSLSLTPLILIVMSIIYALTVYPIGKLSDKKNRYLLLIPGIIFLFLAHLVLGFSSHIITVFFGVILWGLHMGCTQGLLSALVTDTTPAELRGTAYGIFNLTSGITLFSASFFAGFIWDQWGSQYTFFLGAFFSLITLIVLSIKK
ncbi:MAG: MFS transporter [Alphaproteobacteria bacterium]|nr:MFS transporter [Alphaproteobacteria bacterium]